MYLNKYIKVLLPTIVILMISGCAPSIKEVSNDAWFKNYKTFDQQIKEIDISKLENSEKEILLKYASLSKYNACKKIDYIVKHGGALSEVEYSKILQSTAHWGVPDTLQCMVDLGANIYYIDYNNENALFAAIENSDDKLAVVKKVVELGVDLQQINSDGKTALELVDKTKDYPLYLYLLSKMEPQKYRALKSKKELNIDKLRYISLEVPQKYQAEINCASMGYKNATKIEKHILSKTNKIGNTICKVPFDFTKKDVIFNSFYIKVKNKKTVQEALDEGKKECRDLGMRLPSSKEFEMLSKAFTQENLFWYMYKNEKSYRTFMTSDKKQFRLDSGIEDTTDWYTETFIRIGCVSKSFENVDFSMINENIVLTGTDAKDYNYALIKIASKKLEPKKQFNNLINIIETLNYQEAKEVIDDLTVAGFDFKNSTVYQMLAEYGYGDNNKLALLQKLNLLSTEDIKYLKNLALARANGFDTYEEYALYLEHLSIAKAHGCNSWDDYQLVLKKEAQLKEAKAHGYSSWEKYQTGLRTAKWLKEAQRYGFETIEAYQNKRRQYPYLYGESLSSCNDNDYTCNTLNSLYEYESLDKYYFAMTNCFNLIGASKMENFKAIMLGVEQQTVNDCRRIVNNAAVKNPGLVGNNEIVKFNQLKSILLGY